MARAPWSEAIDLQRRLRSNWNTTVGRQMLFEAMRRGIEALGTDARVLNQTATEMALRLYTHGVYKGEPYFWSAEMCDLLIAVAKSVPLGVTMGRERFSPLASFMVFEKPLPVTWGLDEAGHESLGRIDPYTDNDLPQDDGTRDLGYRYLTIEPAVAFEFLGKAPDCVMVSAGTVTSNIALEAPGTRWLASHFPGVPMPAAGLAIGLGAKPEETRPSLLPEELERVRQRAPGELDLITNMITGPSVIATYEPILLRYLIAIESLLGQKLAEAPHTKLDRAARREFGTPEVPEPTVKVVNLRKRQHTKTEGESQPVDWSHRWMVSPHFRMQRVGEGRVDQKRVLILSYVKGPPDKPLVINERLFNVVR